MRFVLIGPPASGKGTQGHRLAGDLALSYLSTGYLLRSQIREKTPEGLEADVFLKNGQYVPDTLIFPMVERWLDKHQDNWIIDGFPRTLSQAEGFDKLLGRTGGSLNRAIALEASFDTLAARVSKRVQCPNCSAVSSQVNDPAGSLCKCGGLFRVRFDDDLENFRSRHQQFERFTLPVVDFYRKSGRLKRIDASGSADDVFERLQSKLTQDM